MSLSIRFDVLAVSKSMANDDCCGRFDLLDLVHGMDPQRRFPFCISLSRNRACASFFFPASVLPLKSCESLSALHDFLF